MSTPSPILAPSFTRRALVVVLHGSQEGRYGFLEAILTSADKGADGVCFIPQGVRPRQLRQWMENDTDGLILYARTMGLKVGVNPLGYEGDLGDLDVDFIWTDHGPVVTDTRRPIGLPSPEGSPPPAERATKPAYMRGLPWFGGVAFKYAPFVPDADLPGALDAAVLGGVDCPTTSGDATAVAANPRRVATLAEASRRHGRSLALASGVSPENVADYPGVGVFFVASSLETKKGSGILVPSRVRALADAIHAGESGAP